ncbi:MAG: hypothetical protein GX495_08105 [Chloroflexi bacterium]|jgi:hypothetical protein|nr:hypothetical protein [Chloroflexota bacterium]
MPAWLKAGLIGAGILIVLDFIALIPILGCLTLPLTLVAYVAAGVLAAYYMLPPRTGSAGAGQGALAAGLAAVIGGLVSVIITLIQSTLMDASTVYSQIPPEVLDQLADSGISPDMFVGPGAVATIGIFSFLCCSVGVVIAAALGALAGAVYASTRPH